MHSTRLAAPPAVRVEASTRGALALAERVYLAMAIAVFSGGFLPLLHREAGAEMDSDDIGPLARLVLVPIYGMLLLLVGARAKGVARTAAREPWPLLVVVLAIASTAWSVEPDLTLRRGVAMLAPSLFGLYLATRWGPRDLLRIVALALLIAAVASIAAAVALPAQGISDDASGTAWRGVYATKNVFARAMGLGCLSCALVALDSPRRRWAWWGGAALTAVLVLLARSATAGVVLGACLVLIPLVSALRFGTTLRALIWIGAVFMAAASTVLLVTQAEMLFAMLGRDVTLTGRTPLWAAVAASIAERPWLGYGYSAFWSGWGGPSMSVVDAVGWGTPHAHNGFLDLWLDLGALGVVLFLIAVVAATRRGVRLVRMESSAAAVWPVLFVGFLLLSNLTESAILRQHNLLWILFVAAPAAAMAAVRRREPVVAASAPAVPLPAPGAAARRPVSALSPGIRLRMRR